MGWGHKKDLASGTGTCYIAFIVGMVPTRWRIKMNRRIYKVLEHEEAIRLGARPFSKGEHSRFALVAMNGDNLDNVIAWGYRRETLESKATERNDNIGMLRKMILKTDETVEG
jgi:hypothetical protein